MIAELQQSFQQRFANEPLIIRSPGRINIIGEHTDYNNGFVLPAAIDKAIFVAVSARQDDRISLYAAHFQDSFETSLTELQPHQGWPTYILGVIDQLQKRGCKLSGINLAVDGDIPSGAGLSSSAAVECAVVFALNELFQLGLSKMDMVKIAQLAEHTFAGVKCGIMDMFASMFGKKDAVIRLDCRSLEYEYRPLQLDGYEVVLLNTNVKHSLASSAYNERRHQCEQAVAWIQAHHPEVHSLRDATIAQLDQYVLPNDSLVYQRSRYVVEEIQRLLDACDDLQQGNIAALGQKLYATHEGLSKAYEVSCKELDYLVDAVKSNPAVAGARMMGGGFGGCTINIMQRDKVDEIVSSLSDHYKQAMGLELTPYIVSIADGTSVIK